MKTDRFRTRAKQLRLLQTAPEAILWRALRNKQMAEWKFRRQHPLVGYVVDFASIGAKLIVEVDGDSHGTDAASRYDAARTRKLEELGFEVLRVTNADVRENPDGVLQVIHAALLLRSS